MKIEHSIGLSTVTEEKLATISCLKQIEKANPNRKYKDIITIVIATENYNLEQICETLKAKKLKNKNIGFLTQGLIYKEDIISTGIMICNLYSDKEDTFYTQISEEIQEETYYKGKKLAKKFFAKFEENIEDNQNEKSIFLISDVIATNIQDFLDGFYFVLGTQFPLFGGGVGLNKKKNVYYQMHNLKLYNNCAIGIMMDTQRSARTLFHGYKPLTKPFIITKSEKNVIKKIDGEDAYTKIKKLLNINNYTTNESDIKQIIKKEFPLGTAISKNTFIIRIILNINEENEIICANNIPEQSVFYVMQWKKPKIVKVAIESSAQCQERYGEEKGNILFITDCVSRFANLKLQRREEIIQIRKQLKNIETIGFLSYGEIGAIKGNRARYHNKSVSLLLL